MKTNPIFHTPNLLAWALRAVAAMPILLVLLTIYWNWQPLVLLVMKLFSDPAGVLKTLAYGLPLTGWALYGAALWIGAAMVGRLQHRRMAWESPLAVSGGLLMAGSLFQLLWASHTLHMWMYFSGLLPAPANRNLQALLFLIALIGILMVAASLHIRRLRSELDDIV